MGSGPHKCVPKYRLLLETADKQRPEGCKPVIRAVTRSPGGGGGSGSAWPDLSLARHWRIVSATAERAQLTSSCRAAVCSAYIGVYVQCTVALAGTFLGVGGWGLGLGGPLVIHIQHLYTYWHTHTHIQDSLRQVESFWRPAHLWNQFKVTTWHAMNRRGQKLCYLVFGTF